MEWYQFNNTGQIDTPALVIYPDRVIENIERLKRMVSSPQLLRPHVKTNKCTQVTRLMIQQGIHKFKCATIAEAEMLGMCEAKDALLAYQPTLQKFERLLHVVKAYPATSYSCLVDNVETAGMISEVSLKNSIRMPVFIDLNAGMGRTGIHPGKAFELFEQLMQLRGIEVKGFHAYDGHIRDKGLAERTAHCNRDFEPVETLRRQIRDKGYAFPLLIAGGSPTFAIHAERENVECSPGTFIFWDKGYHDTIPEQEFLFAAVVLTRVISLPDETKICIDLGYKALASENDLQNRVYFLNAPYLKPYSHSEEHMVIDIGKKHTFSIGDELFALPVHICPTVAMYDDGNIVTNRQCKTQWKIEARGRKITI
ncbi:D-TA family PLP-dependent enzyme [Pedobacter sp. BS3]|uniref:D-TA family PLP-dependent enzyme n=1 Tax=Pedobacter sp. BS3 TaxID=2567937 RepID=UPI0011EBCE1F|nr:D-TA family PLP-dependent enzyme [Pedobacter sp. BS3]TZF82642.1 D-TA family PLP-dependent enzyme [Pedobacter sp. BS3]